MDQCTSLVKAIEIAAFEINQKEEKHEKKKRKQSKHHTKLGEGGVIEVCTFLYRRLGCLAFSLRFWQIIKQLLTNCLASDWTFSLKTANFR